MFLEEKTKTGIIVPKPVKLKQENQTNVKAMVGTTYDAIGEGRLRQLEFLMGAKYSAILINPFAGKLVRPNVPKNILKERIAKVATALIINREEDENKLLSDYIKELDSIVKDMSGASELKEVLEKLTSEAKGKSGVVSPSKVTSMLHALMRLNKSNDVSKAFEFEAGNISRYLDLHLLKKEFESILTDDSAANFTNKVQKWPDFRNGPGRAISSILAEKEEMSGFMTETTFERLLAVFEIARINPIGYVSTIGAKNAQINLDMYPAGISPWVHKKMSPLEIDVKKRSVDSEVTDTQYVYTFLYEAIMRGAETLSHRYSSDKIIETIRDENAKLKKDAPEGEGSTVDMLNSVFSLVNNSPESSVGVSQSSAERISSDVQSLIFEQYRVNIFYLLYAEDDSIRNSALGTAQSLSPNRKMDNVFNELKYDVAGRSILTTAWLKAVYDVMMFAIKQSKDWVGIPRTLASSLGATLSFNDDASVDDIQGANLIQRLFSSQLVNLASHNLFNEHHAPSIDILVKAGSETLPIRMLSLPSYTSSSQMTVHETASRQQMAHLLEMSKFLKIAENFAVQFDKLSSAEEMFGVMIPSNWTSGFDINHPFTDNMEIDIEAPHTKYLSGAVTGLEMPLSVSDSYSGVKPSLRLSSIMGATPDSFPTGLLTVLMDSNFEARHALVVGLGVPQSFRRASEVVLGRLGKKDNKLMNTDKIGIWSKTRSINIVVEDMRDTVSDPVEDIYLSSAIELAVGEFIVPVDHKFYNETVLNGLLNVQFVTKSNLYILEAVMDNLKATISDPTIRKAVIDNLNTIIEQTKKDASLRVPVMQTSSIKRTILYKLPTTDDGTILSEKGVRFSLLDYESGQVSVLERDVDGVVISQQPIG